MSPQLQRCSSKNRCTGNVSSSRADGYRHFAPVQKEVRHNFDGLAQRIGCVTGAFHESQKLNNSFFFFRTLQVEFVREPPAGRRNIRETKFAPLVELPLDRKLRLVDPHS